MSCGKLIISLGLTEPIKLSVHFVTNGRSVAKCSRRHNYLRPQPRAVHQVKEPRLELLINAQFSVHVSTPLPIEPFQCVGHDGPALLAREG